MGAVMMIFLIIGSIVGILLGLRFKVFVLVPAILIAAGAIVANPRTHIIECIIAKPFLQNDRIVLVIGLAKLSN
jgi:hypothetical protein